MTFDDFKASLQAEHPPGNFSVFLKSLWYDGKDNWQQAHAEVDHLTDTESAWVHAYLHRKEGDLWNADYWYRRANKTRPGLQLDTEWEQLVRYFLEKM